MGNVPFFDSQGIAVRLRQLTDWFVYILIRILIWSVQALSLETCQVVATGLAWLATDVTRLRYRVVADNVRHVYPQWSDAQLHHFIRPMWTHLSLMVAEVAQARRKIHETSFHRYVKFTNKPLLVRYLLDPRPTVLVTGHYGNFEVAGYVLGMFGFPSFTIARKLDILSGPLHQPISGIDRPVHSSQTGSRSAG